MLQNQQAEGRFLWFPGGIRRSLGEIANGAHKRKNCFLTAKALCVIIYLQNLRRRAPLEAEIQPPPMVPFLSGALCSNAGWF